MRRTLPFAVILSVLPASLSWAADPDSAGIEFFEKKIRPVLAERCYKCHSEQAKKTKGGLRLDNKSGLLKGGDSGPALVPGKTAETLLLKALRQDSDLKMPPDGKLPDAVVADFETWVKMGAPDPRDGTAVPQATTIDWEKARQFWAFQAPLKHRPPPVRDARWPKKELDNFILAELEKRALKQVRPATKQELVRRATFDLIGLPPTSEEVAAFLKDEAPDAFARVVDRLLQSPHYGERWGRYWLDVARYADDQALALPTPSPHAHRYRDWVIQAFNADMPYDRFLRLQLAGDLLSEPTTDYSERLAGLGFQGLGAKYHKGSVPAQVMADELDDRIDTLSRGLLGLTVACARCHDHKYDPIPTRDYYSLATAYNGAAWSDVVLTSPAAAARFKTWQQESKQKQTSLQQWLEERGRAAGKAALADVGRYLLTAWRIRVLRQHKAAPDEAALARQEKLQPYFLAKWLKQIEAANSSKQGPLLKAWSTAANQAAATAKPLGAAVTVPDALRQRTDELQRAVRAVLQELDRLEREPAPKKKGAGSTPSLPADKQALLKAFWLDAAAPFAVNAKDIADLLKGSERKQYDDLKAELARHAQTGPPPPTLAHGVSGGGKAMPVYIRGNVERPGATAPPGFLRILQRGDGGQSARPNSPRLDLADAIATAQNPLTARVLVNRVWQHHFGRGIVATASNFGKLGNRPTHPELLDTLAVRFVESGWSVKWLHREIMLSAAYQLSAASDPSSAARDPDNHYLWRMAPRRLDVEAWRDALLAVSGRLDRTLGGPSLELSDAKNVRRTIYGKVSRFVPSTMLALFDFPDANVSSAQRGATTVPQQQLFALNSDFMIDSAKAFAARLAKAAPADEQRIVLAFQFAYGRTPTQAEKDLGLEFLRAAAIVQPRDRLTPWEQYAQILLATNEFLYVD